METANNLELTTQINPKGYYAASTIIKNGWFPWIKHIHTFRGMLETKEGQELYKPVIRKAGKYTFYKIKGETLLKIISMSDKGELRI